MSSSSSSTSSLPALEAASSSSSAAEAGGAALPLEDEATGLAKIEAILVGALGFASDLVSSKKESQLRK